MVTIFGMTPEQQNIVIGWCQKFKLELPEDDGTLARLAKAKHYFQLAGGSPYHTERDVLFLKPS